MSFCTIDLQKSKINNYNDNILYTKGEIMRIAICDDDNAIIELLTKYIRDFFERSHLKCPEIVTYPNGELLLKDTGEKDIVFLDVEMPGLSGICVGGELKKRNKNILIFIVTSYAEYLDEAMRFQVFRYLSKPIDKGRLFRNMKDALRVYNTSSLKIPVETKQGVYAITASELIFVEAQGRKVTVHTTKGDYESVHGMSYWTGELKSPGFFQSHRSFIVNLEHVTDFPHDSIHLYNHQVAYLTRRRYTKFKEAYLLYMESMR